MGYLAFSAPKDAKRQAAQASACERFASIGMIFRAGLPGLCKRISGLATRVLTLFAMADTIIVMPGTARLDCSALVNVAAEFGWGIELATRPDQVEAIGASRHTRAVLFCRDAFGPGYSWREVICLLKACLPGASLVALHGFSELTDWQELSEAGAFHSLWLPLKENEVRQSLGFLARRYAKTENTGAFAAQAFRTRRLVALSAAGA